MAPRESRVLLWLTDFLIRWRRPIFAVAMLLTVASVYPASKLTFNESIEALYADDDPHLRDFLQSKRWFGGDELVGVSYRDPKLFEDEGMERITALAAELSAVPGVLPESTQNLAKNLGAVNNPLLARFLSKRKEQVLELFRGVLVGDDNETTAIVLRLAPEQESQFPRGKTIAAIRRVAADHAQRTNMPTFVVGEPVQVHDMFRYVQEDGATLGWASSILLTAVILIVFRRIRWVLLPVLVVQSTLLWTKAILVVTHLQLSMVSSILNSLITVIGVATVMHMTLVYCEFREELDRTEALRKTFVILAADIFWVCATTAGGFAAELSSHVYPVQSFGLMMTLGSMIVLAAIAAILPGGILLGQRTSDPHVAPADKHVGKWLFTLSDWIERHPWRLTSICLAVAVVSLCGMSRIRVETDFSRNFRETSLIVQALNFVEKNLGGAGTWEVNFPAPAELEPEFLDRVRELADRLRELQLDKALLPADVEVPEGPPLTKVVAITDGVDLIPRIPIFAPTLEKRVHFLSVFQPEFVPSLYNPQAGRMRIVLRARERQRAEVKQQLIAKVESLAREHFPAKEKQQPAQTTGMYVLLTFLIDSLLGDQWTSFFWGVTAMVGMMTIAYRSIRIGLISLVPNLLPIAMVVGVMGWLDLPINIASAMISAVSLGLTIDQSIFYISGFRYVQEEKGLNFFDALRATQHGVGRALVYSNSALIMGFLVLTLSHFIPLVYFGLLVSLAMLGGLAGNLVLLPLMMRATGTHSGRWR